LPAAAAAASAAAAAAAARAFNKSAGGIAGLVVGLLSYENTLNFKLSGNKFY
jgi:hypothetical protein